jgi:EmrB/QacA subfamily drug resistance transporter
MPIIVNTPLMECCQNSFRKMPEPAEKSSNKLENSKINRSQEARKDRYIITFMVLVGVLMAVVDGSVVSIALPTITGYFSVDMAQSQWVMTGYLVTLTSLLLIFGKVSERLGRVRQFKAGFALFTLSSLLCGLATSLPMLVIFRVMQALGGAMIFSISAAIIFQVSPEEERGRSMGYIGSTVAIGSIIGPTLGGVIVQHLGWEYIFLVNVPIGICLLALASRKLKLEERVSEKLDLDWRGAFSLVAFMASLMFLLNSMAIRSSLDLGSIWLGGSALLFLGAFLRNESRCAMPLLDLSIFKNRSFALSNLAMVIFFTSNLMIGVLGPFYFEGVMGYSPSEVGLVYLIVPTIMVFGSPLVGFLYDRHHFNYYAALGLTVASASMILMGLASREMNAKMMLLCFIPLGVGSAIFQSPNNAEVMSALGSKMLSTASSVTATVRNLGMALGVSISSILISIQLSYAGHAGSILDTGPGLTSEAISNVMIIAGALCIIGVIASMIKNS